MLLILKGELIKKGREPVEAIMEAIQCSEKTARDKLDGKDTFSVPEALAVKKTFFGDDSFDIEWLFHSSRSTA